MSNLVDSTGRRLAREMERADAAVVNSASECYALESAANALLASDGDAMILSDVISRPIGASAIKYGSSSVGSYERGMWDDEELLAIPANVNSSSALRPIDVDAGDDFAGGSSVSEERFFVDADGESHMIVEPSYNPSEDMGDHVADAMGLRDIVAESHMSYADALDLVSFYNSPEGLAIIAAQRALGAKRRNGVKHVSRDANRRLVALERAEARGRIAPHLRDELAELRVSSADISIVDVYPANFEHSYPMEYGHIPFEYASHRGYAVA